MSTPTPRSTVQSEYSKEEHAAMTIAEESLAIAEASIDGVLAQQDTMRGVHRTMDESDRLLDRSFRLLRGMTWTGALWNWIESSALPTEKAKITQINTTTLMNATNQKGTTNNYTNEISDSNDLDLMITNLPLTKPNKEKEVIDENTQQLYASIHELKHQGEVLACAIHDNMRLIDKVASRQNVALEKTYELTLRTSQAQSRDVQLPQLVLNTVGYFEFTDVTTGRFIGISGQSLSCNIHQPCVETLFVCQYCEQGGFYALQHRQSKRFLGVNAWGSIGFYRCSVERTERLLLEKSEQGSCNVLVMSANWGRGAWLQKSTMGDSAITSKNADDKQNALTLSIRKVADCGML